MQRERYAEHLLVTTQQGRHMRLQVLLPFAVIAAVYACDAAAQRTKPSQTGTVSQEVGSTKIAITYDRPVARGRELFGKLVKYGEYWTPGANWATTIELSDDVLVEEQPLAKGKYSIWSIPGEKEWTIIFSKRDRVFHTRYPEGDDVLRIKVQSIAGEHMETLAYYFPVVGPDSAVLHIHWGNTIVPINIKLVSKGQ
jgi:hypothetical protein